MLSEAQRHRRQLWLSFLVMTVGVFAVYARPTLFDGSASLVGSDFQQLHQGRIEFAQDALAAGRLPEWYPKEQLGAPFRSNVQSFPWIPTRFALYVVGSKTSYALGVLLSALLAACFTQAYCLRFVGPWAAALAGWTFACSGYFAARVLVGHLPLLEAYPALPLLLWLVERAAMRPSRAALVALALATSAVCLAGHPQLPCYAVGVALLIALRRENRWRTLGAIATGIGASLFAWIPCLFLIRASSRAGSRIGSNDLSFPWGRLPSLVFPWRDGQPEALGEGVRFHGYPHDGYFWDTVCYVGVVPLVVAVGLGVLAWRARRSATKRPLWLLELAALGACALLVALPWVDWLRELIPITILRSPARQVYVTVFALSCGLAYGVHYAASSLSSRWIPVLVVGIALHCLDLGSHARTFIHLHPQEPPLPSHLRVTPLRVASDGFVGAFLRENSRVGVFDSLILARTKNALHDLCKLSGPTEQFLYTARSEPRVLRALGVVYLTTFGPRDASGLELIDRSPGGVHMYRVVGQPISLVTLFSPDAIMRCGTEEELRIARATHFGSRLTLHTPDAQSSPELADTDLPPPVSLAYQRPHPERVALRVDSAEGGYVRVLESYASGWSVLVDGEPSELLAGDGFSLAVFVPAGIHEVVFEYRTPGSLLGAIASLFALGLGSLCLVLFPARRTVQLPANPPAT